MQNEVLQQEKELHIKRLHDENNALERELDEIHDRHDELKDQHEDLHSKHSELLSAVTDAKVGEAGEAADDWSELPAVDED